MKTQISHLHEIEGRREEERRIARQRGKKIKDQPAPRPNDGQSIWQLVISDMQERERVGIKRYGTPLQSGNGRDALVDAYQEALDLCVYLRQAIEERGQS